MTAPGPVNSEVPYTLGPSPKPTSSLGSDLTNQNSLVHSNRQGIQDLIGTYRKLPDPDTSPRYIAKTCSVRTLTPLGLWASPAFLSSFSREETQELVTPPTSLLLGKSD